MRCPLLLAHIVFFCPCLEIGAQDMQKAMQPFRSELWQREFRTEDNKDAVKPNFPDQPSVADAPGGEKTAKLRANPSEAAIQHGRFPGQMEVDELRDSTPIAEWQIDSGADRPAGEASFRGEASAWELSHAGSTQDQVTAEMAEGPSITTYLVGLMACIVVVGALFTGREM